MTLVFPKIKLNISGIFNFQKVMPFPILSQILPLVKANRVSFISFEWLRMEYKLKLRRKGNLKCQMSNQKPIYKSHLMDSPYNGVVIYSLIDLKVLIKHSG